MLTNDRPWGIDHWPLLRNLCSIKDFVFMLNTVRFRQNWHILACKHSEIKGEIKNEQNPFMKRIFRRVMNKLILSDYLQALFCFLRHFSIENDLPQGLISSLYLKTFNIHTWQGWQYITDYSLTFKFSPWQKKEWSHVNQLNWSLTSVPLEFFKNQTLSLLLGTILSE